MRIVDLLLQGVWVSTSYYVGRVILKRSGSTCKLHTGYCDSFGFCITVDSDDIMNSLRDAFKRLFSKAAMNSLWDWIKGHWYVRLSWLTYLAHVVASVCTVAKRLTGFKRCATTRNNRQQGVQTEDVTSYHVRSCWPTRLRPFVRGLSWFLKKLWYRYRLGVDEINHCRNVVKLTFLAKVFCQTWSRDCWLCEFLNVQVLRNSRIWMISDSSKQKELKGENTKARCISLPPTSY